MMILANGYHNKNTLKLLCKGRNRLAANNATLGVDDAQLLCQGWFGCMKAKQRNELTSCLTSPWGQKSSNCSDVPRMMSWLYVLSLAMIYKDILRTSLLPVWWLCRQVWLAVTAKQFWILKSCLADLFSLVWRSYMASFMMIGHYSWPLDM